MDRFVTQTTCCNDQAKTLDKTTLRSDAVESTVADNAVEQSNR